MAPDPPRQGLLPVHRHACVSPVCRARVHRVRHLAYAGDPGGQCGASRACRGGHRLPRDQADCRGRRFREGPGRGDGARDQPPAGTHRAHRGQSSGQRGRPRLPVSPSGRCSHVCDPPLRCVPCHIRRPRADRRQALWSGDHRCRRSRLSVHTVPRRPGRDDPVSGQPPPHRYLRPDPGSRLRRRPAPAPRIRFTGNAVRRTVDVAGAGGLAVRLAVSLRATGGRCRTPRTIPKCSDIRPGDRRARRRRSGVRRPRRHGAGRGGASDRPHRLRNRLRAPVAPGRLQRGVRGGGARHIPRRGPVLGRHTTPTVGRVHPRFQLPLRGCVGPRACPRNRAAVLGRHDDPALRRGSSRGRGLVGQCGQDLVKAAGPSLDPGLGRRNAGHHR